MPTTSVLSGDQPLQCCPAIPQADQLRLDGSSFGRRGLTDRCPARQDAADRIQPETDRSKPTDEPQRLDGAGVEYPVPTRTASRCQQTFVAVVPNGPHRHTGEPRQLTDTCAVRHNLLNLPLTGVSSVSGMTTEDIWHAVDTERLSLLHILEQLSASQWRHSSLCDRWQVRDVVAHVVLSTQAHVGRILVSLLRARGNLDRMVCDTAVRHAANTTDHELLEEMRSTIGSRFTAVGTTPTDRLMDLLVHEQDIAVPLGLHHEMPVEAAQLALEHIWHPRFPFHAATKLAPYQLRAVDTGWAAGEGPLVEGPVSALLLLATGRETAALPRLRGAGVELLRP